MTVSLQLADASTDPRPVRECKRCSYIWRQAEMQGAPTWCPRCGSAAWDRVPRTVRARRPSDPPNPRWKQRKRQSPPPYDYDRMERGSDAREPQADPRVPAGIPRNYILEPYVPKVGGVGLPPPPSLRSTTGLPPPPQGDRSDNRSLDSSSDSVVSRASADGSNDGIGGSRGYSSRIVSGVAAGSQQDQADMVRLEPPRTQVVSAPMPAPSLDEMDRELKSQAESAWLQAIAETHVFPEPDLEYALAAAQGESE